MLLTVVLTCFVYCTEAHTNLLRIFGGRDALEGEFPYVVQIVLGEPYERWCTASVLTATWTLTAAHCVEDSFWRLYVEQGQAMIAHQHSVKSEIRYSKIVSTKMHPAYNVVTTKNDIALLHTEPVHVTKYGKLSAIHYTTLYGQEVTLVGYGMFNYTSNALFPIPQVLEAIARECQNEAQYAYPKICFAPRCSSPPHVDKSLCPGDSGGPAIHASGIIAVTSTSERDIGTCVPILKKPRKELVKRFSVGTSTPTGAFVDWILSVINTEIPQINN